MNLTKDPLYVLLHEVRNAAEEPAEDEED